MDVLLPVFVAVLLAETGGKVQANTHQLGLRFPNGAAAILCALLITSAISLAIAAIGGAIVADMIDLRARTLLCGLALVFAGAPMLLRLKPARPVGGAHPFAAALPRFAAVQFGDASQFIVFAITARGDMPVLATFAGGAAIVLAGALPIMLGRDWPGILPLAIVRRVAGIALLTGGLWLAAVAFRVL